jgi:hypothetical protein
VEKYGTAIQETDENVIRRMRIAYWITKATETHSECIILPDFPRQQWLRERASTLRHTYMACLFNFYVILCNCARYCVRRTVEMTLY